MKTTQVRSGRKAGLSHLAVRQALLEYICREGMERGQPLPSIREISRSHRVSKAIAERAVRSLVEDGICYAEQGRGVFLAVDGPGGLGGLAGAATVGVVFGYLEYPRTDHVFYRQVYEGTQEWISDRRCNVLRLYSWRAKGPAQKGRELAQFAGSLGGLLALGIYSDADCILLRDTGLPLVVLDYDTESLGIDCAVLDNYATMHRLGRRVMAEEPGEVFMVSMERKKYDDPTALERRAALEKAMAESGRSFRPENWTLLSMLPEEDDLSRLEAVRAAARTGGERPAVVSDDDSIAPRIVAALGKAGLAAGRDYLLAYAGPEDLPPESVRHPALVGASDFRELGRAGAELLGKRMESGPGRPVKVAVPGRVREIRPQDGGSS